MTEEKEMWTIDELVTMTEEVQQRELEWGGKTLSIQWCELTEAEEPKMALPDDNAPAEEQTEYYKKLAGDRVLRMIEKANGKQPELATVTEENWGSLPTTLRWQLQGIVLGTANETANFTSG